MRKCLHCGWSFNPAEDDDEICLDCEALIEASMPEPMTLVVNGVETPEGRAFFAHLFREAR